MPNTGGNESEMKLLPKLKETKKEKSGRKSHTKKDLKFLLLYKECLLKGNG